MRTIKKRYLVLIAGLLAVLLAGTIGLFFQARAVLAESDKEEPQSGAILHDRDGTMIAHLGTGIIFTPLDKIPRELQTAIIDFQDERFQEHQGFSKNSKTITQRLAQQLFQPKGAWGRLKLAILPTVIERRYSKREILEMYLNRAYFGEDSYGAAAASQAYFGKSVQELQLEESALLAALVQEPEQASPFAHPQKAMEMRGLVLEKMHKHGHLSQEERERAQKTPLTSRHHSRGAAPHFADYVQRRLEKDLSREQVLQGGLEVQTSLDLKLQNAAESIFKEHNAGGALVALDPQTGGILAMSGGLNYEEEQENLATAGRQKVGSTLRPLIYALALKEGWAQNHLVEDAPQDFNGFSIENSGERYWGPVTMKHAFTLDLNTAAAWTLDKLGVPAFLDFAQELNLDLDRSKADLALVMGDLPRPLSLLDLTQAFLPFANKGNFIPAQALLQVNNAQGRKILDYKTPTPKQIMSPEQAYLLTDLLMTNSLELDQPAAFSTTFSQDGSLEWCLGYTPALISGVLVQKQQENKEEETPPLARQIWAEFVEKAAEEIEKGEFEVPENVETNILIDVFTGLLANSRCPQTERDAFLKGTAPVQFAPCAQAPAPPPRAKLPQEPPTTPGAPPPARPEPPITEPPPPPTVPEPQPPPAEAPEEPEVPVPDPLEPEEPSPKPTEPEEPSPSEEENKKPGSIPG
ncbi:MAG: hypothetical protein GX335_05610 [Firmicutes bacterium]|nr:hypothetical protein [Bacillota bacterium]